MILAVLSSIICWQLTRGLTAVTNTLIINSILTGIQGVGVTLLFPSKENKEFVMLKLCHFFQLLHVSLPPSAPLRDPSSKGYFWFLQSGAQFMCGS